jgi:hypothetical protein
LTIHREVVPSVLTSVLGGLSFGQFSKRYTASGYTKMFHLQLYITTSGGRFLVEKNEVINAIARIVAGPDSQDFPIPAEMVPQNETVNDFLSRALSRVGNDKFFYYSAANANCQDWILNLLNANDINTQEVSDFVKQDTAKLFDGLVSLRKISNSVTDIAAKADVFLQGGSAGAIVAEDPIRADIRRRAAEEEM